MFNCKRNKEDALRERNGFSIAWSGKISPRL